MNHKLDAASHVNDFIEACFFFYAMCMCHFSLFEIKLNILINWNKAERYTY